MISITRNSAAAARLAHNQEVRGSTPLSAISNFRKSKNLTYPSVDIQKNGSKFFPYLTIFLVLGICSSARGADVGCGKDTDQNGSVDAWCTGAFNCTDLDGDGYCTNGLGPLSGIDCNDQDFFDHPGGFYGTNTGCTSNQSKVCQSDGTYAPCANFCPSTALRCLYIDPVSGNDTTGDGSWANPWKTSANMSDATTPPGTAITRLPGDWYIYKGSPTFGDTVSKDGRNVGWNLGPANDGTSVNPIGIAGAPGYWPTFDSTGSASFVAIHDEGSYYKVIGFKVLNSTCNGYTSSVCIGNDDGTGIEFANLILKDNIGNDNTGGIMFSNAVNSYAHHFFIINQGQNAGNTDNTAQFLGWRGTGNVVTDFVLYQTTDPGGGETFKVKHANYSTDWRVERFAWYNGQAQFASRQTTLKNGLILDGSIAFNDAGGPSYTGDELLQYLTFKNADSHFLSIAGYANWDIDGTAATDKCSSDFTISNIVFRDSIVQDSDSNYVNQDDRFLFMGTYDGDPMVNEVVAALTMPSNVFYNPNVAVSFGIFERNNGVTTCAGYGDYSGAYSLSGLGSVTTPGGTTSISTTGSVEQNPSFSSLNIGTCASCSGKGWNANWGTASSGSSAAKRKGQLRFSGRKGQ